MGVVPNLAHDILFSIEFYIFTHGHNAKNIARMLPIVPQRIVNRGDRHPKGGLVYEWGIPQSGSIRYVSSFPNKYQLDCVEKCDCESIFLDQFDAYNSVFERLRNEFGCEFEVIVRFLCTSTAPVLNFGPRFSRFLGDNEVSLTILQN